jgi:MYXO-CTERM domain-containing protein
MLRRVTLLLGLLPGIALGQTTLAGTVTATVNTQGIAGQANRVECASNTSNATWNIAATSITITAGDKWRLATLVQAGNTGCATTPPAGVQDVTATGATQSIPLVPVRTMGTAAPVGDCLGASDVPVWLCAYYLPGGSTVNAQVLQGSTAFNFQLAIPPKPVISSVGPGDKQLSVNVVAGTTTATERATASVTYTVTCTPAAGGTAVTGGPASSGTIVCGSLTNGVAYTVAATGLSAAGNSGPASDSSSGTPLPFVDFWQVYKDQGGVEAGGCSTSGAGAMMVPALALLGLLAVRRRRS